MSQHSAYLLHQWDVHQILYIRYALINILLVSFIEISFDSAIACSDASDSDVLLPSSTPAAVGGGTLSGGLAVSLALEVLIEACVRHG